MAKAERLEDLGRLKEKLKYICDSSLFEFCGSKHEWESWKKEHMPEDDPDLVHRRIRHISNELSECLSIATGDYEYE